MSNEKLSECLAVTKYELDAEGPSDVAWVPISDFSSFMAIAFRSVGTGGYDEFKILGNTAADGSGTDVELKDYANFGTLANVNAVGDWAMLELTQADLDAAKSGETPCLGVSVSLGHVTGTDESVVTYIRGASRKKHALLTAQDSIA